MKNILLLLIVLPLFCFAQKKENRTSFRSIASSGIIIGEKAIHPVIQWSGGIKFDRHFAGLGIGYDRYRFNTIPVFADWRMDLDKERSTYIYVNAGHNFATKYKEEIEFSKLSDRVKGGFYMDLGVGCRVVRGPLHGIIFSAGYSRKDIKQTKSYRTSGCSSCEEYFHVYKYNLDRVVLKVGWEIGR